jgi:hypothetical protein
MKDEPKPKPEPKKPDEPQPPRKKLPNEVVIDETTELLSDNPIDWGTRR